MMKTLSDQEINDFLAYSVSHDRYKAARKIILHAMSTAGWEDPICPCIYGPPGAGKSFLCEKIKQEHSPIDSDELTRYLVVFVTMTGKASVVELHKVILKGLGIDVSNYKESEYEHLVYTQLMICGVKLIIIDEFHHLVKSDKQTNTNVCNAIKLITDKTNIPVALIGIERGKKLFEINPELKSRYSQPYELSPMGLDPDHKRCSYFAAFLAEKMTRFPLPCVDISKGDIPYRFLLALDGDLRVLKKLWRTVLTLKSTRSKSKITLEDYETAYEYVANKSVFTAEGELIKPFTEDFSIIKRALGVL